MTMTMRKMAATPALSHALPLVALLLLSAPLCLGAVGMNTQEGDSGYVPALSSYENSAVLKEDTLEVYWSVDPSAGMIQVALNARTSGWVALGLSEVGSMVGSDAWVGWVANGTVFLTDRFLFNESLDASGVALDSSQDLKLVAGQEAWNATTGDTWTTIHFWRLLSTGDCNDRTIARGQHIPLIWAIGATDELAFHGDSKGSTSLVLYPGAPFALLGPQPTGAATMAASQRGGGSEDGRSALEQQHRDQFQFRQQQQQQQHQDLRKLPRRALAVKSGLPSPATSDEWINFTAPGFAVPETSTNYACNAFTVRLPEKRHAMEWGAIINTTNPELLHHMVLLACEGEDTPKATANYECFDLGGCSQYYAVWALGANPVKMPAQAGLPVGPGTFTTFVLQIHYTNPTGLTGVVDSSGMFFRMSPSLREHDAGILELGPVDFGNMINIPPKQPAWTQETSCPGECTAFLPDKSLGNNITIFASTLHLHSAGKQMFTDVYRKGKKIATIGRQDYYDFAFQQFIDLSPGLWVLPGDELRTRCVWDTSLRTNVTKGGFASEDEMCINYVLYYPRRPILKGGCYNFCAFVPKGYMIGDVPKVNCSLTPEKCSFNSFGACAAGIYVKLDDPCPDPIELFYGNSKTPYEPLAGCAAESALSLQDLDSTSISTPAAPVHDGIPPASNGTSGAPAPAVVRCTAPGVDGTQTGYMMCQALAGGFNVKWNVLESAAKGSGESAPDGNVTLSLRFSGASPGWIAFGISPNGGMVGSSIIAGWNSAPDARVEALYIGGKIPSLITQGGVFRVEDKAVDVDTALDDGGNEKTITIFANISVPVSMASQPQDIVWAKGRTANNFLGPHEAGDAHQGQLAQVDCRGIEDVCSRLGIKGALHSRPLELLGAASWMLALIVSALLL